MKCSADAGRTGKWWAIEHSGVEPDIVCMAKGIASGMPLGICMTRAEHYGLGAGLARVDFWRKSGIDCGGAGDDGHSRARGDCECGGRGRVHAGAGARLEEEPSAVGDVRGRGLMIGIELVKDKATREPAVDLRNRVETLAFERGLMVLGCGETSLRLSPPLIVSKEEATVALDILEESLAIAEKEHEQSAMVAATL